MLRERPGSEHSPCDGREALDVRRAAFGDGRRKVRTGLLEVAGRELAKDGTRLGQDDCCQAPSGQGQPECRTVLRWDLGWRYGRWARQSKDHRTTCFPIVAKVLASCYPKSATVTVENRDAAGAAALQIRGSVGRWVSSRGLQRWAGRASSHWSVGDARQATICSNRLDVPMRESALAPQGLSWRFSPQPLMPLHRPVASPPWGETKLAHQLGVNIDGSGVANSTILGMMSLGHGEMGELHRHLFRIPFSIVKSTVSDWTEDSTAGQVSWRKGLDDFRPSTRSTPRSMFERNSWGEKLAPKHLPPVPTTLKQCIVLMPTGSRLTRAPASK